MAATWTETPDGFQLAAGPLAAHVNCLHPELGLTELAWEGRPILGAALLGVALPDWQPRADLVLDSYVRQGDLITVYRATASRPFLVEVYWRASVARAGDSDVPVVDLLVSIQTDLLDSRPSLVICSQVLSPTPPGQLDARGALADSPAPSADDHAPHPFRLVRWNDSQTSYAEWVHPDDADGCRPIPADFAATGATVYRWSAEMLEKGVIRRVRLRGAIVPRQRDIEITRDLADQFLAQPLPLTT